MIDAGVKPDVRTFTKILHAFAINGAKVECTEWLRKMWEEYKDILVGLKSAGFLPFYVARQPNAEYLKVQEGSLSLYNRYEVGYGNLYR